MIVSIRDYARVTKTSLKKVYEKIKKGDLRYTHIEYETQQGKRAAKGIEIDDELYKNYVIRTLSKEMDKYVTCHIPINLDTELIEKYITKIEQNEKTLNKIVTKKIKVKKKAINKINEILNKITNMNSSHSPFWVKVIILNTIIEEGICK